MNLLRNGLFTLCLSVSAAAFAAELPHAKPSAVGLSAAKLAIVDAEVESLIQKKRLAGAIVAIAKDGKVAHFKEYGKRSLETGEAMTKDSIFRIYSMTKSITTAAALMLFDAGKYKLDDSVAKHLPEFKNVQVHTKDGQRKPSRPVTVRDLMRHTSGLTYGIFGNSPVDQAYRKANVLNPQRTIKQMARTVARLPLAFDPGTDWTYSVSTDVLGRLVEVWSGQTFDTFLQQSIFEPLYMKDTGFHVPANKLDRCATIYNSNGKGGLSANKGASANQVTENPKMLSGGGGLLSTTRDYLHFLQMIASGGELFGHRLLKKSTVKMMTRNQVPAEAMPIGVGDARPGVGFGLGFSVRTEMSEWDPEGKVGEYGWGGMASTHYWISPKDKLVVVTMEQTLPYSFLLEFKLKGKIYDAIQ
jgi:CubicO group peptidase (beta-lactamase class C family)